MSAHDRVSLWLMLLLSFGTGVLDAATYLGLHGVFTANMTGNLVFIGLGLAPGDAGVPLLRASLALGSFVVGGLVIGLVQRNRAVRPNADTVAALSFVLAALLTAASAVVLYAGHLGALALTTLLLDGLTSVLGFAMGAQAVAARRVGVPDVSTVVVTSTLAALAADGPLTGNTSGWGPTGRRLGAVLSMGTGAVVGAVLLADTIALPVALAALILLVVGLVSVSRALRARRGVGAPPRPAATLDR